MNLINLLCFGAVGVILATAGVTFRNWQLWIILVLVAIVSESSKEKK